MMELINKNVHDIHLHALLNESAHKPLKKEPYNTWIYNIERHTQDGDSGIKLNVAVQVLTEPHLKQRIRSQKLFP